VLATLDVAEELRKLGHEPVVIDETERILAAAIVESSSSVPMRV
jgi:hypothetical protein